MRKTDALLDGFDDGANGLQLNDLNSGLCRFKINARFVMSRREVAALPRSSSIQHPACSEPRRASIIKMPLAFDEGHCRSELNVTTYFNSMPGRNLEIVNSSHHVSMQHDKDAVAYPLDPIFGA